MGWENPELLHEKGPIEKPQDFLTLTLAKEAGQTVNTHGLELKESLKPVSVRQKKKQNKVRRQKNFCLTSLPFNDEIFDPDHLNSNPRLKSGQSVDYNLVPICTAPQVGS